MSGAKNIPEKYKAESLITPEGDIIGWKNCRYGIIVKLLIPAAAKRRNDFAKRRLMGTLRESKRLQSNDVGKPRNEKCLRILK